MNKLFIFLIHKDVVVPQSLEEFEAGEIIRKLLQQDFYIPPVHIYAEDSTKALRKFQQSLKGKSLDQRFILC